MSVKFDPYYMWLAIPPEEQPPNLYRLLGVKALEANLDVIENAADQRMLHLRTYATGKQAEHSQKLLNEVQVPAKFTGDRREYVDLVQRSAAAALPKFKETDRAQPIHSPLPGKDNYSPTYLAYVVTVDDLKPNKPSN